MAARARRGGLAAAALAGALLAIGRLPLVLGQAAEGSAAAAPHRRFEYKYSFKGPHLVQADGTVPFWVHTGNAIPSADQIRITTSLKSQRGSVWTKNKSIFEYWEVEVTFRVTGRGRIGADGLAIWFTEEQGLEGPVFGAADEWNGVGIFFDSFDNDGKKNNPGVIVVGNNGKLQYDHQNDGSTQALASCQRDFRNKPYPVRVKITYYQKTLTVLINNGFTPDKEDYEFCAKVEEMVLPSQGYFGISAATGGLADDHDVLSFLTFQLTEPGKEAPTPDTEIPQKDKDKYQEEFEHFQQELDKKKEEFQKEHPDVQGHPADDLFETVSDRELRQIFEGQNRIHLEIKQLNRQLDMILDEQRRYVSAVTDEIAKRGAAFPGQQGQVSQQEIETVVKTQEEVARQVNEIRSILTNLKFLCQFLTDDSLHTFNFYDEVRVPRVAKPPNLPPFFYHEIPLQQVSEKRGGWLACPSVAGLCWRASLGHRCLQGHLQVHKNSVADTLRLMSGAQHPGSAAGVYETTQHFNDIKEHLHVVKRDIEHLVQRNMPSSEKSKCPDLPPFPSCLSTMHFFIFVAVQTVLFIGYIMYRSQQEAAAKKFF